MVMRQFARQLDGVLAERVYDFNHDQIIKSAGAKEQVKNDLEKCLFPLFQISVPNSAVFFPRLAAFVGELREWTLCIDNLKVQYQEKV